MYSIQPSLSPTWEPLIRKPSEGRSRRVCLTRNCISQLLRLKALRDLQAEKPAYAHGSEKWWADVIQRTALGAGADANSEFLPGWPCTESDELLRQNYSNHSLSLFRAF
jgi:hypothetical protein